MPSLEQALEAQRAREEREETKATAEMIAEQDHRRERIRGDQPSTDERALLALRSAVGAVAAGSWTWSYSTVSARSLVNLETAASDAAAAAVRGVCDEKIAEIDRLLERVRAERENATEAR